MSDSSSDDNQPVKKYDMKYSDSDSDENNDNSKQPKKEEKKEEEKPSSSSNNNIKKNTKDDDDSDSDLDDIKNKIEQKKEELKGQVLEEGDKLKVLGGSLADKVQATKEKIKNMGSNLKENPNSKEEIAAQAISNAKDLQKDVAQISQESQDLKKASIGAVGAVLGTASSNKLDEEKKRDESPFKPRPKRENQALKFQIDEKTCMQIRKESYNVLKSWDDKCQEYFNLHRAITDAAFTRLERRCKISIESSKNIIIYFQHKAQFEQNYCKSHQTRLPKLSMLFKDVQDSSTVMYPLLSQSLQECDDMNDQQMKLVQVFAAYIEKNILKDMLVYEAQDFEKKVTLSLEKIQKAKLKAKANAKEYSTNSQKYQKVYHDLQVTESKATKKDRDFYNNEIKFKKAAVDYMRSEREYGLEVWRLWSETQRQEKNRLDLQQRVFKMYLEKYKNTYGVLPMMEQQVQTWNRFEPEKEAEKNYSLNAILNSEDIQSLKKGTGKEEVQIEDAEYYMSKFQCSGLDKYSKLVLQTFSAQRDVATMKKIFKQSELVVTIDDFLLFFDDPSETEITKASKKLAMKQITIKKIKNKTEELYVVEKVPGMVYNTTNKILVKFENEEEMNEFVEYVAKFTKVGVVDN